MNFAPKKRSSPIRAALTPLPARPLRRTPQAARPSVVSRSRSPCSSRADRDGAHQSTDRSIKPHGPDTLARSRAQFPRRHRVRARSADAGMQPFVVAIRPGPTSRTTQAFSFHARDVRLAGTGRTCKMGHRSMAVVDPASRAGTKLYASSTVVLPYYSLFDTISRRSPARKGADLILAAARDDMTPAVLYTNLRKRPTGTRWASLQNSRSSRRASVATPKPRRQARASRGFGGAGVRPRPRMARSKDERWADLLVENRPGATGSRRGGRRQGAPEGLTLYRASQTTHSVAPACTQIGDDPTVIRNDCARCAHPRDVVHPSMPVKTFKDPSRWEVETGAYQLRDRRQRASPHMSMESSEPREDRMCRALQRRLCGDHRVLVGHCSSSTRASARCCARAAGRCEASR